MTFLEKDLEDIIFESPNEEIIKRGLPILGKKIRQKRIGNYGIADLITYRKEQLSYPVLLINVYELKKSKIDDSAIIQGIRYCKGIKNYLENRSYFLEFTIHLTIIGDSIDTKSDLIFLTDLIGGGFESSYLSSLDFYTYKYDFDGIKFKPEYNYKLINEGFNNG